MSSDVSGEFSTALQKPKDRLIHGSIPLRKIDSSGFLRRKLDLVQIHSGPSSIPRASGLPPEKMVMVGLKRSNHLLRIWLEPRAFSAADS